jgi:hypothetical protein
VVGILHWLKKESINGAGRRMVAEVLGERQYLSLDSSDFFRHCYDLRSRIVHADSGRKPERGDIDKYANELERFVSDLITAPFLPLS